MKLIKLSFIPLVFGCFNSFGQINKGTKLLGGNIGFIRRSISDEGLISSAGSNVNEKTFSFGPKAAMFLTNNLAVGIMFNFKNSQLRQWSSYDSTFYDDQTKYLVIGPFARYFHFITPELAFFGQASLTYNHNHFQKKYLEFSANVTPGLAYFISSKVGLEMNMGGITHNYGTSTDNGNNRSNYNEINLRLLSGMQIGVSSYLGK